MIATYTSSTQHLMYLVLRRFLLFPGDSLISSGEEFPYLADKEACWEMKQIDIGVYYLWGSQLENGISLERIIPANVT